MISDAEIEKRKTTIEDALSSYGVEAKVIEVNRGPTVTQFGVEPGWDRKFKDIREKDGDGNVNVRQEEVARQRVKVERINSLSNDLALALAAPSIRIEAPVPGKSLVGIEVPNTTFGSVGLRGVMESTAFQKMLAKSKLALALGKGAGGETVVADLTKMPAFTDRRGHRQRQERLPQLRDLLFNDEQYAGCGALRYGRPQASGAGQL